MYSTTNVIYNLTCICRYKNAGETSKKAHTQAKQHLKALTDKKPKLSNFAENFISKHSQIKDTSPYTLLVLYKCNSYLYRKIREALYIK